MTAFASRPALWMICGAFAFATMGAAASALGSRCDWLLIALVRTLFMLASAIGAARASGVRLVVWRPASLWLRSLAGSFSLVCNFYAFTRLPVADVLTLANAYPLWIILLSAASARRVPAAAELIGVCCALVGVVLIQRPELGGDRFTTLVVLAGSMGTALAMLGLHRLKGVAPWAVMAHFSGVASVLTAAWMVARTPAASHQILGRDTVLLLLGVGLTGTIGQFFLTKAYAAGVPTRISVVALTQVVFGLAYDVLAWGRVLTPTTLAGIALVLAPSAWLSARSHARPSPVLDATDEAEAVASEL
jgi:drug/metabolite transporter (DMT)-like permease